MHSHKNAHDASCTLQGKLRICDLSQTTHRKGRDSHLRQCSSNPEKRGSKLGTVEPSVISETVLLQIPKQLSSLHTFVARIRLAQIRAPANLGILISNRQQANTCFASNFARLTSTKISVLWLQWYGEDDSLLEGPRHGQVLGHERESDFRPN